MRSYDISVVRYPDGTVTVTHRHIDGEWWRRWIVGDSEELAFLHANSPHYGCPGISFVRSPYRIEHPKKFVLVQSGGLDI